jgi:DNA-binding Xre family transcriptional regulator
MNKSVVHNVYRMPSVSNDVGINARKNLTAILQGIGKVKQVRIAEAIGKSEATVSRMKDGELMMFARLLAVCGLKVVPEDMVVLDRRQIDALVHLAQTLNRGAVDER